MLKIGVTGGVGSGKTIICKIFRQLHVPVYEADAAARELMNTNAQLKLQLKKNFGEKVYNSNDTLNSSMLAKIVFNDSAALQKLNTLVHPLVQENFKEWLTENTGAAYVIKEAAILFESGSHAALDFVIMISAPENIRFKRVMMRSNLSEEQIKAVAKNQMAEEEKIKMADFVILNDETRLVLPQVIKLHRHFCSLAKLKK